MFGLVIRRVFRRRVRRRSVAGTHEPPCRTAVFANVCVLLWASGGGGRAENRERGMVKLYCFQPYILAGDALCTWHV